MNVNRFLKLAKTLADKSDHPTYRFGCILFKKNQILNVGFNQLKTHPRSKNPWQMLHAETHCIIGADQNMLKGSDMFVYMIKDSGNVGLAKPCTHCEAMLRSVGIRKVYYTTRSNGIQCLELN